LRWTRRRHRHRRAVITWVLADTRRDFLEFVSSIGPPLTKNLALAKDFVFEDDARDWARAYVPGLVPHLAPMPVQWPLGPSGKFH
jgi:hypothetical protein